MTNLIKELIGDKPSRLMLQLPRLKYDISVSSDYIDIWEKKSVLYSEEIKEYKYKADDTSMGSLLPSKASHHIYKYKI